MANNGTKDSDYVVGLDIGTSKVVCIIGRYVDQHSLEVVSMGSYPSSGLKKGVVVNIDATTDAIQKSIDQAASRKLIHRNAAARTKSRLVKLIKSAS